MQINLNKFFAAIFLTLFSHILAIKFLADAMSLLILFFHLINLKDFCILTQKKRDESHYDANFRSHEALKV